MRRVDAQRHLVAVEDVGHVEDVPGATHEAEHPGDVHGVAWPLVREEFAELRALEGREAAGGARRSPAADHATGHEPMADR
jgi:hypothetical protein